MHSKGSVPANCRKSELAELQAAANRINASGSQSFPDMGVPIHDPSWLWDAFDIDEGALHQDLASSSMNLTCNDALMFGVPEEMQGHQWFWPDNNQQDMSTRSVYETVPQ